MIKTEQSPMQRVEDARERDNPLLRYRVEAVEARLDALMGALARWAESTDALTEGERTALLRRLAGKVAPTT